MIIETEPSGLMMIRYKFYFNQQNADPEDPWVLAYFQEHSLEPRRELHEEHEGIPYKVFHFGQCYLGRHVRSCRRCISVASNIPYWPSISSTGSITRRTPTCARLLPVWTLPHGKNSRQLWQRDCMPQPSSRRRKTEICAWCLMTVSSVRHF